MDLSLGIGMLTRNGPSLLSRLIHRSHRKRLALTPSECALWNVLRMRKLGVRVRRQWVLAPYIVDFYIPSHRLVIEVDGEYHASPEQRAADVHRERELIRLHGVRVVRFSDEQVLNRPASVVAALLRLTR